MWTMRVLIVPLMTALTPLLALAAEGLDPDVFASFEELESPAGGGREGA